MKCFLGICALFSLFITVFCKFTDFIVTIFHRNGAFMIGIKDRELLQITLFILQVKAASEPIMLMVFPHSWTTGNQT
jgi:hypothetical protein